MAASITFHQIRFQNFNETYSVTKSWTGHQLQKVHKGVIPNCKDMLNVLYHIPWSTPKVVLRVMSYDEKMKCHFWVQNGPIALNETFFGYIVIWYNFDVTFGLLVVRNLQKVLRAAPELWLGVIFGSKMTHFPWVYFFSKNH